MNLEYLLAILGAISGFVIKWGFDYITNRKEKDKEDLQKKLDKNTEAIIALNVSMVELKIKIEYLSEKLSPIPKMQNDLNELHGKMRSMKNA